MSTLKKVRARKIHLEDTPEWEDVKKIALYKLHLDCRPLPSLLGDFWKLSIRGVLLQEMPIMSLDLESMGKGLLSFCTFGEGGFNQLAQWLSGFSTDPASWYLNFNVSDSEIVLPTVSNASSCYAGARKPWRASTKILARRGRAFVPSTLMA